MKFRSIAALLALSSILAACVSGTDSTPASAGPTAGFQAQFNPDFGILPFPNDLYSGTNGQLNIPGDPTVAANGPILQLNHLDGYGTQSDISAYFTSSIDPTSISASDVIVLKVTSFSSGKSAKAVNPSGSATELVQSKDYIAEVSPGTDVNGSVLTIKPLHPLAPSTVDPITHVPTFSTYMVIITRGLKDTNGNAASPSEQFSEAEAVFANGGATCPATITCDPVLLAASQFTAPQLALATLGLHIPIKDIALTFSFSTQFLGIALAEVALTATATTQPTGTGIFDTTQTVCQVLVAAKQLPNSAACAAVPGSTVTEVFAGDVALPYYQTVPSATNPTAALTDSWRNAAGGDVALNATNPSSFIPMATVAQNVIPILVAIPTAGSGCSMPGGGWPVTIFQHGITRNREDMLAAAAALSVGGAPALCTAVLAIDLPLHGVTDKTDPFYKNQLFKGTPAAALLTAKVSERTFDMDLENNSTGAAGPDGTLDGSGAWFINLSSTVTSRDNLREGAADLLNLVATLPNLAAITPPATVNIFDHTKVFFVGHSLGAIVGTTFLGADAETGAPKVTAAVLAMPGGHVAELLRNSATFEPIIDAGLAAQGLQKGTQEYFDFYSQAQAVVEDGDPANYAAFASNGHLIHMIEVVGGLDAGSPPDKVVPNSATDVLIAQMGITATIHTAGPNAIAAAAPTLSQFISGDHGSILNPAAPTGATNADVAAYGAVTAEMQSEMASLVFSTLAGGSATVVTSTTYLSATLKP